MWRSILVCLICLSPAATAEENWQHTLPEGFRTPDQVRDAYLKRWNGRVETYNAAPKSQCADFDKAACTEAAPKDPTGKVLPFRNTGGDPAVYQKQNEVLKDIVKSYDRKRDGDQRNFITTEYVKRQGLDKKIERAQGILKRVQAGAIAYLESLDRVDARTLEVALARIKEVTIRDDYFYRPDALFKSGADMDPENGRITLQGNFLLTTESTYALFFVLAHEMHHFLSSSRLPFPIMNDTPFADAKKCLQTNFATAPKEKGVTTAGMEEVEADWFAQQLYASYLGSLKVPDEEKVEGTKNIVRFFCGSVGSVQGHPGVRTRANLIVAHPRLTALVCRNEEPPARPYCGLPERGR